MPNRFFCLLFLLMSIITSSSCSTLLEKKISLASQDYPFKFRKWSTKVDSEIIVIAIHGYNDYSNSFEKPAKLFSKFNIETVSFDLRGFGKNDDFGEWFPLEVHTKDLSKVVNKILKKNPNKKIFLLGESMGAAILVSFVNKNKSLPIEGIIFVAPAFWNISESNPIKSKIFKLFSFFFPQAILKGNSIIKVRPTDNIEMLKKHSKDPYVVNSPKAKSLSGLIELLDNAYEESRIYLSKPFYKTLIVLPLVDEIVPRMPIIKILKNKKVSKNFNKNLFLSVHEKNFHMILRDLDGDRISREIKEWIQDKKRVTYLNSFQNPISKLEKTKFYHKLD